MNAGGEPLPCYIPAKLLTGHIAARMGRTSRRASHPIPALSAAKNDAKRRNQHLYMSTSVARSEGAITSRDGKNDDEHKRRVMGKTVEFNDKIIQLSTPELS